MNATEVIIVIISFDFSFESTNCCCPAAAEKQENTCKHDERTVKLKKNCLVDHKMASNDASVKRIVLDFDSNIGFSNGKNSQLMQLAASPAASRQAWLLKNWKLSATPTHARCVFSSIKTDVLTKTCFRMLASSAHIRSEF